MVVGSAGGLVGRQRELAHIELALQRSREGSPQFSCLVGEAGIGKTRLLAAAHERAAQRGARVLRGSCIAGGVTLPFLPLLEMMGSLAAGPGEDAHQRLLRDILSRRGPAPSGEVDERAERARLLESVASLLAESVWTVLLIDDLQWADASTSACVEYLTQRVRAGNLMVLATSRDGSDLPPLVADGRRLTRVDVDPLTDPEVVEHATGVAGRRLPKRLLDRVVARSGGNPFVVEELLAEVTAREPEDVDTLPASLDALLGNRLELLPPSTRRALECLSVLDRPAGAALLRPLIGDVEETLGPALAAGVIQRDGPALRLRHPLFGELIRRRVDANEAQSWHALIADALEVQEDTSPGELAHHRWSAGDGRRALPAVIAAAGAAEDVLAFDEAAIELERAVELIGRLGEGSAPAEEGGSLLARAARAHWLRGDAGAATSRMRSLVSDRDDPDHWYWLAIYAFDAGDLPTALEAFERVAASGSTGADGDLPAARAVFARARLAVHTRRFTEAALLGIEAATAAARAGSLVDESSAHHVTGMALLSAGEIDEGIAALRRGLELGLQSSNPWRIGMGYVHLTAALHLDGRLAEALSMAEEGVEVAARMGLDRAQASDLRARAAEVLLDLGEWGRADELTEAATVDPARAYEHLVRATLELRRGDLDAASEHLLAASQREGQHAAGGTGSFPSVHLLRRGDLAVHRGEPAELIACVEALRAVPSPSAWEVQAQLEGDLLLLRAESGSPERRPGDEIALTRSMRDGLSGDIAFELSAEEARAMGSADADLWAEVAARWEARSMPHRRTWALIRAAEASLQRGGGGRRRAAAVLADALEVASMMGAGPLIERITDLAERAHIELAGLVRPAAGTSALTARELHVLGLLAEGMTNQQIAATLFISPKTVGVHVTRILAKLGAHTRGEAVAVAAREGLLERMP